MRCVVDEGYICVCITIASRYVPFWGGGKDCHFFHCIWTMCFTEGSNKKQLLPAKSNHEQMGGQKNRPIPNGSGTQNITPTV